MKKTFAIGISLSMVMSTMAFPAIAADKLSIDETIGVYANEEEIIIPFSEDITNAVGDISLKNSSGNVSVTYETDNKNLIVTPSTGLLRDTTYTLDISSGFGNDMVNTDENLTKKFKVTTIVETDLKNASAITDYFDLAVTPKDNVKAGVYGDKAFLLGGANIAYLKGDYVNLKNYTVNFSHYIMGNATFIVFNETEKSPNNTGKGAGFGWAAVNWLNNSKGNKTFGEVYRKESGYAFERYADCAVSSAPYMKDAGEVVWGSNTEISEIKYTFNPNRARVDKFGTVGNLYIADSDGKYQFIDSYNTADCKAGDIETGYFGVGTDSQTVGIGDMYVTTYEEINNDGELFVEESEIYANQDMITIPFSSEISAIGNVAVTNSVKIENKAGESVPYTYSVSGQNLMVSPVGGFERDSEYVIKVGTGLGYSGIETKQDFEKHFMVRTVVETDFANASDVSDYLTTTSSSGKASIFEGNVYIASSQNMAYLSGDYSKLENYTVSFPFYSEGNASFIVFNDEVMRNTLYSNTEGEGFGWAAVNWYSGRNKFARTYRNPNEKYGLIKTAECDTTVNYLTNSNGVIWTGDEVTAAPGLVPNYIKIDKLGVMGMLYVKDNGVYSLKDTFNTMDCSGVNTPSKGYFGIGTDNQDVGFGDIIVTTYEEMQYGDITFNASKDIYASTASITVPFNEDISSVNNVSMKVSLTDTWGGKVPYTYEINENELVITPESELERDVVYGLEIASGFGYSGVTMKDSIARFFKVKTVVETDIANADSIADYFDLAAAPGSSAFAGIYGDNAYIQKGSNIAYLKGDYNTLKNYTVDFSYYLMGNANFIVFNDTAKSTTNSGKGTGFGWAAANWLNGSKGNKTFGKVFRKSPGYAFDRQGDCDVSSSAYVKDSDVITWADGSYTEIASIGKINNENHMRLEKQGAVGNLYIADSNGQYQLIDSYNTASCGMGIIENGYFGIGTDTQAIGFGNMILTTTEFVEGLFVTDCMVTDENGEMIFDLNGVESVKGTVYISSYLPKDENLKVTVVAYNGNKMIKADVIEEVSAIAAGESLELPFSLEGISGVTDIKVLLWDSLENMIPLCSAYSF